MRKFNEDVELQHLIREDARRELRLTALGGMVGAALLGVAFFAAIALMFW